jgi:hypothetical protein
MTLSGAAGLFVLAGFMQLALALYVLQRMFRRESAPSEQHISFGDALATAYTASQVYEEEITQQADDDSEP